MLFGAIYKLQLSWIEKDATNVVSHMGQASCPHSIMSPLSPVAHY